MLRDIEDLAGLSASPDAFEELGRYLDRLPRKGLTVAMARAEELLASWPDHTRMAQRAWERIQHGHAPPAWWSLVRHVRVETGETLKVGPALEPLTSVDASESTVSPQPLVAARRLRYLDLSGNDDINVLDFLSGQLRIQGARLRDLSPLAGLRNLQFLTLRFCELGALSPVSGLPLRLCDLTGSKPLPKVIPARPGCDVVR